jgi:fumarate hydratase subunit beta
VALIEMRTPLGREEVMRLEVGDLVVLAGDILAGRDAVLPRLAKMTPSEREEAGINLEGAVVFHTAVSSAGIGPTSSNKVEIEGTMPALSRLGVRMHVGKGALGKTTVQALAEAGSVFAVVPPVSALQTAAISDRRVLAFSEEGMEALHLLTMTRLAVVIAIAQGRSIWGSDGGF